jgi:hypothetical protein
MGRRGACGGSLAPPEKTFKREEREVGAKNAKNCTKRLH